MQEQYAGHSYTATETSAIIAFSLQPLWNPSLRGDEVVKKWRTVSFIVRWFGYEHEAQLNSTSGCNYRQNDLRSLTLLSVENTKVEAIAMHGFVSNFIEPLYTWWEMFPIPDMHMNARSAEKIDNVQNSGRSLIGLLLALSLRGSVGVAESLE